MNKYLKRKFLLALIVLIVIVIQFISPERINPVNAPEIDFLNITNPPAEVVTILKTSCYDCHSNETSYPWYAKVAPFSWIIDSHIKNGREKLNFSTWGEYKAGQQGHKFDECKDVIETGDMPLKPYAFMHRQARLDIKQKEILINHFTRE